MTPMLIFIIILFLFLLIGTALIVLSFVNHINNFQEVLAYGVVTKATVVEKYLWSGRNTRHWIIRYQYHDTSGRMHRGKFDAFRSESDRFQVGDSIDIEYSAKRPHISCFKELLDQSRAAQQRDMQSNRDLSD
jgi:hypothetical protein